MKNKRKTHETKQNKRIEFKRVVDSSLMDDAQSQDDDTIEYVELDFTSSNQDEKKVGLDKSTGAQRQFHLCRPSPPPQNG